MDGLDPKIIATLEKMGVIIEANTSAMSANSKGQRNSLKTALDQAEAHKKLIEKILQVTKLNDTMAKELADRIKSEEDVIKANEDREKKEKEAGERLVNRSKAVAGAIGSFASSSISASQSIYNSNQAFSAVIPTLNLVKDSITGLIDGLGKLLSGVSVFGTSTGRASEAVAAFATVGVKLAFANAQAQIENTQRFVDNFQKISKVGLNFGGAIEEMRQSAVRGGMSLDSFTKFVTENASNLTILGGSIQTGADRVLGLGKELSRTNPKLIAMYGSVDAVQSAVTEYAALQARYGTDLTKTNKDLKSGALEYLITQKELSELTGKSVEQLRKDEEKRQNIFAYNLVMNRKSDEDAANTRRSIELSYRMGGKVAEDYATEYVATNGRVTSEQALMFRKIYPEMARTIDMQLNATNQTTATFNKESAAIIGRMKDPVEAELRNKENIARIQAGGVKNIYTEIVNSVGAVGTGSKTMMSDLAAAVEKQEDLRNKPVTEGAKVFAKAVTDLEKYKQKIDARTELLMGKTGDIVEQLYRLQETLDDTFGGKLVEAVDWFVENINRAADALGKISGDKAPKAPPSKTMYKGASEAGMAAAKEVEARGGGIWEQLKAKRAAEQKYREQFTAPKAVEGITLGPKSGTAPIDVRLQALMTKIGELYPGTTVTGLNDAFHADMDSKHARGQAIDFAVPKPPANAEEAIAMRDRIKALGFTQVFDEYFTQKSKNWSGPHFHAELKEGGVTKGPSLAGEAGPEAVVPLPDGRTIPVKMDMGEMRELFEEMLVVLKDQRSTSERIRSALS